MLLLRLLNLRLKRHRQSPRHRVTATKPVTGQAIALLLLTTGMATLGWGQTVAVAQSSPTVLPTSAANSLARDLTPSASGDFFQQGRQQMEQEIQRLLQSLTQPEPTLLRIQTQSLQIRELANPPATPAPVPPATTVPAPAP